MRAVIQRALLLQSWAVSLLLIAVGGDQQTQMTNDVLRMIRAAEKVARLMPPNRLGPEVDLVVRHGKAVAPLLLRLLSDDPDDPVLSYEDFDARKVLAGKQFAFESRAKRCDRVVQDLPRTGWFLPHVQRSRDS